jgi:hypothetical protein
MSTRFLCLGHARAVRDKWADYGVRDVESYLSPPDAAALLERICSAQGDWRDEIKAIQQKLFELWNGEGAPDWRYLDEMGDAIAYIVEAERVELAALTQSKP